MKFTRIILCVLTAAVAFAAAACTPSETEGEISVSTGAGIITVYDKPFADIMKNESPATVYVRDNEQIVIDYHGNIPYSAKLTECLLDENGASSTAQSREEKEITLNTAEGFAVFDVGNTPVASSGNEDKAVFKGYHLECTYQNTTQDRYFIIKGDPEQ